MVAKLSPKQQRTGWIIWLIGALFYCYVIAERMYPSIMMNNLMHHFHADAGKLTFILTSFYLSYSALQIPVGIIVDRFDIRKVLIFSCLVCLGGQALFIMAEHFGMGSFARFIIGIGAAFSYVSALKLASIWLPKNRFGLMTCATDSMGSLAVFGVDLGLVRYMQHTSYQSAMWLILIIGFVFLVLIALLIRDRRRAIQDYHIGFNQGPLKKQRPLTETLVMVMRNPQAWIIGVIGGLSYLPAALLQDQWGMSYFHNIYHLTALQSGSMMEVMALGWIIAGPFIGIFSDYLRNRKLPLRMSFILCAVFFSIIFFVPLLRPHAAMPIPMVYLELMLFLIGVGLGTHPIAFVIAKENFSNKIAGTTIGFTNTLIMFISYIGSMLAAQFMDLLHGSAQVSGTASYSLNQFTVAMSILPIAFVICLFLLRFIKETGSTIEKSSIFPKHNTGETAS
jgi:MFS family permease